MTTKRKRLTQREKDENLRFKKEMQKKGILPPDKPRLNRKKFAQEVVGEFEEMDVISADRYLREAIGCMVSKDMLRVSEEQIGVLKLLKIAVETQKYMKALEEEGHSEYKIGEYIDNVVIPILKL